MSGGFKKNTRIRAPDVLGTKISVENAQLLVSTGAPEFDNVIGGGLAVGTLLLIEEDRSNSYASLLTRLFLAEGVLVGHPLLVASKDKNIDTLISSLPAEDQTGNVPENSKQVSESSDMKIAWRYQHMPNNSSDRSNRSVQFGHHFDLSRNLVPEVLSSIKLTRWSGGPVKHDKTAEDVLSPEIQTLLESVKNSLAEHNCWVQCNVSGGEPVKQRTVLRMAILSLGSPLWEIKSEKIPVIFYALRAILRASCAVCLVTIPSHFFNAATISRCRQISDYSIQLIPAIHIDGKVNPLLSGQDGLFKINKLPSINTITPYKPATLDLGFKVRRKKFCIEKLQLPPEIAESEEREQDDFVGPKLSQSFGGCGSGSNKNLEF
ncbi:elongator complex protein 4 [Neocloeon triangulifer]|uniref:elongator complex protein 4 n=1 Tax=Neocloeon triangulifer TaxID=2078957 RepID=UPI00286F5711|nr:elongator complex protein 4 [Neocloeon triangulifer]